MENFILEKIRKNPEAMAKLEEALDERKKAEKAHIQAKISFANAVRNLAAVIAEDDEEVADFSYKRPKLEESGQ